MTAAVDYVRGRAQGAKQGRIVASPKDRWASHLLCFLRRSLSPVRCALWAVPKHTRLKMTHFWRHTWRLASPPRPSAQLFPFSSAHSSFSTSWRRHATLNEIPQCGSRRGRDPRVL